MPKGIYERKPRKPSSADSGRRAAETVPPKFDQKAVNLIFAGLDSLAWARDYASTIAHGQESKQDLPALAVEMERSVNQAGETLEQGLRSLGVLADGVGGYFILPKPKDVEMAK